MRTHVQKKSFFALVLSGLLVLTGCGGQAKTDSSAPAASSSASEAKETTPAGEAVHVKVGVVGEVNEPWEAVKKELKEKENIDLELVIFSDYNQPNAALADGSLDINSFQHRAFLENWNKETGGDLQEIGVTMMAPLGIYSQKYKQIGEIPDGGEIAIPSDASNGGRALILLQSAGLIEVAEKEGLPTISDITANPKNLKITELDASQTSRVLPDVAASIINSGMAVDAGLIPSKDAIFLEKADDSTQRYWNIIVARKDRAEDPLLKKIVSYYQTDAVAKVIEETSKGSQIPVWKDAK